MQRRAAAVYFVLLVVISAGAYAYTGMADKPHVDVPGETYGVGDTVTVDGRTYTVNAIGKTGGGGGGHGGGDATVVGNLTWTDPGATYTATLSNNSTVSWQTVSWDDQRVESTTLANGTTVGFNESSYVVALNGSADPGTVQLWKAGWPPAGTNASNATRPNVTFEQGGTISVTVDERPILDATITDVSADTATLSWGSEYLVVIPNETNPGTVSMIQQQNLSRMLEMDPGVKNNPGQNPDGSRYVEQTNGDDIPLAEYLPEPEVKTFEEGDTVRYDGNETMIGDGNITRSEVVLTWTDERRYLVELSEGAGVDLNGESYLVHFSSTSDVQLVRNTTANFEAYQDDQHRIDVYNERMAGLWGVSILSLLAGVILLAAAYMPVKD